MDQAPTRLARGYNIGAGAFTAKRLDPGLYIVSTPIGHLEDITIRALETLAAADVVLCEDTRVTRVLCDRYGITTRLSPYHDHNAEAERPRILAMLANGAAVALVSDAGTPLISDPGYKLVAAVRAAGQAVTAVPGASAALAALVAAGLPTDRFLFVGFLPQRGEARRQKIEALRPIEATLVLYEAANRCEALFEEMIAVFGGERAAALCREMTKKFEEVRTGTIAALAATLETNPPRGEVVVLVAPPDVAGESAVEVEALLRVALDRLPVGQAAAEVARLTGADRKQLYRQALAIRAGAPRDADRRSP
jgi:16S rRNA (cytidine1402-2'-O)-methyltransferase